MKEIARAVIGHGIGGTTVVLATDSHWIMQEIEDISDRVDDLGMIEKDPDAPGVYLWEGTMEACHVETTSGEDRYVEYRGTLRPVCGAEFESLMAMRPPSSDDSDKIDALDLLIVKAVRPEVVLTLEQQKLLDSIEIVKRDWRIGCSCKPKMRTHELYYERGEIVEVFPNGTAGIHDKDGVLKIRMQTGRVLMAPADEWQTA